MSGTDFTELLQEAEKLSSNIESTSALPKVDRSLRQVLEASNELYTRVRQTGANDIQANLLLGSKGIDLPQISQKLESISAKRTFEPLDPIADNDVQTFLKNEIENIILGTVNSIYKKTLSYVTDEMWAHSKSEWKQEKRKILNAMIGPSHNFIDLEKSDPMSTFKKDRSAPSTLTHQEQIYAREISEYNKMIVRGATKPILVNSLAKAAEQFKETKVNEMWEMLRYMLELPPFPRAEDPLMSRYSKPIKTALVDQAKNYLEERYKTYMSNVINENLQQARRGGVPGTYPLVRSFVGIRLQGGYLGLQDGMIEDRPLWPMIYYCLRSGDFSAALYCIQKAGYPFEDLVAILQERIHNSGLKDLRKLEVAIRFQYRRQVRNSTDPFKRAVYCLLGCCEVNDCHSEVAKTADDYLWLKLSLVRDDAESEEHISYADLQTTILEEYGEAHYDAKNQPHLYFQMLVLTGQFEAALEFLARSERYKAHAVHFAVAIHELGMMGAPRSVDAPLLSVDIEDVPPSRRLNIARLILLYVKRFEITNPLEAIHYYYVLRNLRTFENYNLFMVCVGDLAKETRDYDRIFGRVQSNGLRSAGLIDQFTCADFSVEVLAEKVANDLVKKGLFEDAVKLYDLADNQEEMLTILCTLLSQVVQLPQRIGSVRERLQVICNTLTERSYSGVGFKCTAPVASSFRILRDLMLFFDKYHAKQYSAALESLISLQLIPLSPNEVDERVTSFKGLAPEVCKIIPDILLATMNILYEQYKHLKNSLAANKVEEHVFTKQLQFIRDQAKAVTNFAGSVPYRMPGDTNTRLVQMEILMH